MGQSFFIWKNADCRAMGVQLSGPVPIVRPEDRVQHTQIPGRSGDLTETEGQDVYNSYIQTASILVPGGFRVRDIYNWLRGSDYVTFSGEPDRRQPARIIGAITLNKHSHNLDWWTGEVQFYCQPLKQLLTQAAKECGTSFGQISSCVTASVSETAPVVTITVETTNRKLSYKLAQKIAEIAPIKVAEVVDGSSMRIIDEPLPPGGKASPNSRRSATTGFLLGFILSTLLLVFMDLVYDTVQSGEDMERRYGVPVIGHIPDAIQAEKSDERYGYKQTGGDRR